MASYSNLSVIDSQAEQMVGKVWVCSRFNGRDEIYLHCVFKANNVNR